MVDVGTRLFTVGVFQDVAWAEKGLAALKQIGLAPESLTILAKDNADVSGLMARTLGTEGTRLDLPVTRSSLTAAPGLSRPCRGGPRSGKLGLAGTMRRVGFQAHDSRIFEALVARGGVLVASRSEPRAADALAVLHSYGGGNAAIGAWTGRL
jgi:hypothetical protein